MVELQPKQLPAQQPAQLSAQQPEQLPLKQPAQQLKQPAGPATPAASRASVTVSRCDAWCGNTISTNLALQHVLLQRDWGNSARTGVHGQSMQQLSLHMHAARKPDKHQQLHCSAQCKHLSQQRVKMCTHQKADVVLHHQP